MAQNNKRFSKGLTIEKSSTQRSVTLSIEHDSASSNTMTVKMPATASPVTVSLPNTGTSIQSESNTATLSNKTISGLTNTVTDIPAASITGPIPVTLLAPVTANRAVQSDGSGFIQASSVTNTELGYLSGVTSAVQTQIDSKVALVASTDNAIARFDGTLGQVQNSTVTISDTGDVVIPGDLTVNGDFVTLNVQTLEVEDQNILVNNNGNDTSAQGAGLTIFRTSTYGSLVYDSAAVSKFKLGDLGSEVEIADISSAQIFTNKDYNVGTASNSSRLTIGKNTKANLDALTRKEATIVYGTDTKQLYVDDGSQLVAVGGSWTPYTTENISNAGSISLSTTVGLQYRRVQGNSSSITTSLTPFGLTAPPDGTVVRLVGQSNDNSVVVQNYDAAKGTLLNGIAELGYGNILELQYDAILDRWVETFRNF